MGSGQAALKLLANSEGGFENIEIHDNQFQCQIYPNTLAIVENLTGLTFERNTWFTTAQEKPFRIGPKGHERGLSFEQWVAATGEKDAKYERITYPDPNRSIENYMRRVGYQGTDEQLYARFFREVRTMRRGAWREEFTARRISDYFRDGFDMKHLPVDELPPVECGPFQPESSYRE